jgi:translation initiation factor 4E
MAAHALETPWTFYYHHPKTPKDWEAAIQKIAQVSTVEEFWAVYSRVKRPEALKAQGTESLHFFRGDSRAMWEDPANARGGAFRCEFQSGGHASLYWERLLLDLIGEQLHPDLIGALVQLKRNSEIISVWTRTSDSPALAVELATQLFRSLGLPYKTKMVWRKHHGKREEQQTFIYEDEGAVLGDQ